MEAFLPIGETLIIPFLYSMKVPLEIRLVTSFQHRSRTAHSPLDGNVDIGEVSHDPVDHLLVLVLSDVFDERVAWELIAELVSGQTVLGEAVVEVVDD